jgi:sulfatase modifying factor 1
MRWHSLHAEMARWRWHRRRNPMIRNAVARVSLMCGFPLAVAAPLMSLLASTSFATAQRLVTIETVAVGDAKNAGDTNQLTDDFGNVYIAVTGSVGYEYRIGKYEVTIDQYTKFLNAVAVTTSAAHLLQLWDIAMSTNTTAKTISRSGSGTQAAPFIYSVIGDGTRPINYISWFNAARFANWLHNGATNGANTENGA